jgi:hypothetical protein
MGNLKQQGYRLMANLAMEACRWVHPVEVQALLAQEGWKDCTDMDDEEFAAFVLGEQQIEL